MFTHSIFKLISLVLGKDIDSLIDELLESEPLISENFYKSKYISYSKIRKKRRFKKRK